MFETTIVVFSFRVKECLKNVRLLDLANKDFTPIRSFAQAFVSPKCLNFILFTNKFQPKLP
jgi:hypothetical protein